MNFIGVLDETVLFCFRLSRVDNFMLNAVFKWDLAPFTKPLRGRPYVVVIKKKSTNTLKLNYCSIPSNYKNK